MLASLDGDDIDRVRLLRGLPPVLIAGDVVFFVLADGTGVDGDESVVAAEGSPLAVHLEHLGPVLVVVGIGNDPEIGSYAPILASCGTYRGTTRTIDVSHWVVRSVVIGSLRQRVETDE
ncbi:hypothetical protein [Natrinema marinum]|uniref:hypothetical protein n=1 Tax=Natrinema marinum TaxID=2961598 RepID=UPI0020C8FD31|nr:hypothetical protein [Natrinema marinum]